MWIGESTDEDILRVNVRPSDAETRQPFVTFQSCLSSSLELGSGVLGISRTPRGKKD